MPKRPKRENFSVGSGRPTRHSPSFQNVLSSACCILFPLPSADWRGALWRLQYVIQREHNCSAKCQVAVSLPCLVFIFQKSLQTLSQFHQKVSCNSYFFFKRKELICIATNFWLVFWAVRTNLISLLNYNCFLSIWTKYSLSKAMGFEARTVQHPA